MNFILSSKSYIICSSSILSSFSFFCFSKFFFKKLKKKSCLIKLNNSSEYNLSLPLLSIIFLIDSSLFIIFIVELL